MFHSTDTLHNITGVGTLTTVVTAIEQIAPHANTNLLAGLVTLTTVVLQLWNTIRLKRKANNG